MILNLKNKIFLGDNGIYLIGSLLVVSIIYEHNKFNSIVYADEIFFLLILPGFDLLRLSLTRMVKGKNAFYGDRNHIHHLLINKFSLLSTNFILIFFGFMPIILFSVFNLSFLLILFVYTFSYLILIYKILNR